MFRPEDDSEDVEVEDWVRYVIYLPEGADTQHLQAELMQLAAKTGAGYLWDRDAFALRPGSSPRTGALLYGHQRLGEQQEDEWMVVKILLQASVQLPQLVLSVEDQDGQFLLIEAADVLPDWLEPETSENRIFICNGAICIIPPAVMERKPKLGEAVSAIRADPAKFKASAAIQEAIKERLSDLDNLSALRHRTNVALPIRIAGLLKAAPELVAPSVNAFCERKDKRAVRPAGWEGQQVTTLLTLTKAHFAKLAFQPSCVPEGYPMPDASSPDYIRHDLGLKLTMGVDLVYRSPEHRDRITQLLSSIDPADISACTVQGQEDSTRWMDVDPGELDDHMTSAEQHFKLNDKETDDLMKKWDQEYDKPGKGEEERLKRSVDQLKGFLEGMSLYDGPDSAEPGDGDSEDDSFGSDEDSSDQEEGDSDFIEFEILETLRHDPDLLMRIIEMNAHAGVDSAPLMAQLKKLDEKDGKQKSSGKQKGLADIDPGKLEEARMPPYRKLADFVDKENEERATEAGDEEEEDEAIPSSDEEESGRDISPLSSSDDEVDVAAHTPTLKELLRSSKNTDIIDEEEGDFSMTEYFAQMDSELSGKLHGVQFARSQGGTTALPGSLDPADLDYNLAKSVLEIEQMTGETGSPAQTLLKSIKKA